MLIEENSETWAKYEIKSDQKVSDLDGFQMKARRGFGVTRRKISGLFYKPNLGTRMAFEPLDESN